MRACAVATRRSRRTAPQRSPHWPQTHGQQWCGEGVTAAPLSIGSRCADCVFWRHPDGGLNPVNRGDMPKVWWTHAGIWARHAPRPDSEPGPRAFWRATQDTDFCADGVAREQDPGHVATHIGKSGFQPVSAKDDAVPVAGGETSETPRSLPRPCETGARRERRTRWWSMALTSYTIDETSVGEVLTPADGFLTDLVMTTPPPVHEVSDHHSGLAFTQSHFLFTYHFAVRAFNSVRLVALARQGSCVDKSGFLAWRGRSPRVVVAATDAPIDHYPVRHIKPPLLCRWLPLSRQSPRLGDLSGRHLGCQFIALLGC
jgi:hypothetical protein